MSGAWFADTSWFLAMIGPTDVQHARAVALSHERRVPLLTTAWVITELADGLSSPVPLRRVFAQLLSTIENDATAEIIGPNDALFRRGLKLLAVVGPALRADAVLPQDAIGRSHAPRRASTRVSCNIVMQV
jgi:hypothetical protein